MYEDYLIVGYTLLLNVDWEDPRVGSMRQLWAVSCHSHNCLREMCYYCCCTMPATFSERQLVATPACPY